MTCATCCQPPTPPRFSNAPFSVSHNWLFGLERTLAGLGCALRLRSSSTYNVPLRTFAYPYDRRHLRRPRLRAVACIQDLWPTCGSDSPLHSPAYALLHRPHLVGRDRGFPPLVLRRWMTPYASLSADGAGVGCCCCCVSWCPRPWPGRTDNAQCPSFSRPRRVGIR